MIRPAQWFIDNGCELVHPSPFIFMAVYGRSNGNPCNGCNCKDTCPAWPKIQAKPTLTASLEQHRDTRKRCGICNCLINLVKAERRGGKCHCGARVIV